MNRGPEGPAGGHALKRDTTIIHAGIAPDPVTGSIVPPIYETATYVLDEVGRDKGFDYTRSSNPTRQVQPLQTPSIGAALADGSKRIRAEIRS